MDKKKFECNATSEGTIATPELRAVEEEEQEIRSEKKRNRREDKEYLGRGGEIGGRK